MAIMINIKNGFMVFLTLDVLLASLVLFAPPAYRYIHFLTSFQCKGIALVLMALGVFLYLRYLHPRD
jgi:hypothetical protein